LSKAKNNLEAKVTNYLHNFLCCYFSSLFLLFSVEPSRENFSREIFFWEASVEKILT